MEEEEVCRRDGLHWVHIHAPQLLLRLLRRQVSQPLPPVLPQKCFLVHLTVMLPHLTNMVPISYHLLTSCWRAVGRSEGAESTCRLCYMHVDDHAEWLDLFCNMLQSDAHAFIYPSKSSSRHAQKWRSRTLENRNSRFILRPDGFRLRLQSRRNRTLCMHDVDVIDSTLTSFG